jgi:hypothetical protein
MVEGNDGGHARKETPTVPAAPTTGVKTPAPSARAMPSEVSQEKLESPRADRAPLDEDEPAAPSKHDQIYARADEGLDVGQIARRLGQQHGEVELILALRPRQAFEKADRESAIAARAVDASEFRDRSEPSESSDNQPAAGGVAVLREQPAPRHGHHHKHKKRHR